MTYAIIKVAGKQYRVREGERLLVGGGSEPVLDPSGSPVTARVLGPAKGPKIRIGKYKKRTGYRRHTGFRASLTQIEIESIGGKPARSARRKAAVEAKASEAATAREDIAASALPAGYGDLTVAVIKEAARGWSEEELAAALEHEQAHGKRKGAIAALESALAQQGGES